MSVFLGLIEYEGGEVSGVAALQEEEAVVVCDSRIPFRELVERERGRGKGGVECV